MFYYTTQQQHIIIVVIKILQHCGVIVGGFNNIALLHDLTSRPGFAISGLAHSFMRMREVYGLLSMDIQWNFYKSNFKGNKKKKSYRNTFFLLVFQLNLHQAFVL
jgi:hypothetical protein